VSIKHLPQRTDDGDDSLALWSLRLIDRSSPHGSANEQLFSRVVRPRIAPFCAKTTSASSRLAYASANNGALCTTDDFSIFLPQSALPAQKYTMEPAPYDIDGTLTCRFNKLSADAKGHTSAPVKVPLCPGVFTYSHSRLGFAITATARAMPLG